MGYLIHHNSSSATVVLAKNKIPPKDEYRIDINPKAPESLQEIVKNLNQRIYGVFVENEKTRI